MTECGEIGKILENMIVKDKAQRMSLDEVEEEFAKLVKWFKSYKCVIYHIIKKIKSILS